MEVKHCLNCGSQIQGRADKKFCDDQCRNNYNYQRYSDTSNFVRKINHILKKNRTILEGQIPEGEEMAKTTVDKLAREGYQFKYMTHSYETKKGSIYYYCYDYGYLTLDGGWVLVVKGKD